MGAQCQMLNDGSATTLPMCKEAMMMFKVAKLGGLELVDTLFKVRWELYCIIGN